MQINPQLFDFNGVGLKKPLKATKNSVSDYRTDDRSSLIMGGREYIMSGSTMVMSGGETPGIEELHYAAVRVN